MVASCHYSLLSVDRACVGKLIVAYSLALVQLLPLMRDCLSRNYEDICVAERLRHLCRGHWVLIIQAGYPEP